MTSYELPTQPFQPSPLPVLSPALCPQSRLFVDGRGKRSSEREGDGGLYTVILGANFEIPFKISLRSMIHCA